MIERFFFMLGLVNSILLICVFVLRKNRLSLVQRFGWLYLLMALPAAYGLIINYQGRKSSQYAIFLGIFLAFLLMEWLLDHLLKINFRENRGKNWKWLVPYLILYYAMNYGFIIMPWKASLTWGLIMMGLFVIQIIANLTSHSA